MGSRLFKARHLASKTLEWVLKGKGKKDKGGKSAFGFSAVEYRAREFGESFSIKDFF